MSVLVLGAKGMLGRQLVSVFAKESVTGWDIDDLDITDEEKVRQAVVEQRPDIIINAAAYTDVDGAETARDLAFKVNEVGVKNLALVAKELEATLVHYSTDYVFPGDSEEGYSEDDGPGPAVNAYGESKLAGERALKDVSPRFFLLRTAWLYGPGGKNFVDTMLGLGGERDSLNVVEDQFGSPTYTVDVAKATSEIVNGEFEPGIYHTVNAGQTNWYEFAVEIFKQAGVEIEVKPIPSSEYPVPAKRPEYSVLRNTKGPELRSWQVALRDYIASVK